MAFKFEILDPRPATRLGELERLAQMGTTMGAEVTVPEFAEALSLGNIDPQHTGGDATTAAIEAAVTWPLPPEGTTIVTVRPDADSLGVMAVLALREEGTPHVTAWVVPCMGHGLQHWPAGLATLRVALTAPVVAEPVAPSIPEDDDCPVPTPQKTFNIPQGPP